MQRSRSMVVIDDEDSICLAFKRFFEDRGWEVWATASAGEGLSACRQRQPAVVFLDVRLPDRSGLDVLSDLAGSQSDVIVITAYGGLDTVVRAIQGKAYDYLVKPLDLDKALALANRIWETRSSSGSAASSSVGTRSQTLVGDSPSMQDVYKLIARVAPSRAPVLIEGQTGTGKELVARAIHEFGPRRDAPFLALNCGAIPENLIESELFGHVRGAFTTAELDRSGRFEAANGGCLLLDEIGDLPLSVQVKLLRVLDGGAIERVGSSKSIPLDVRVLAATNKDLEEEVRQGRFRHDLYYRLAVLRIALPALRARKEDIPALANHFLQAASVEAAAPALSADAVQVLMTHDWPGNVRELKSAIEHALAVAPGRAILPVDLPESVRHPDWPRGLGDDKFHRAVLEYAGSIPAGGVGRCHGTLAQVERALIVYALKRHGNNQSEAAEYLGLHRNTLRNKIQELNIDIRGGAG